MIGDGLGYDISCRNSAADPIFNWIPEMLNAEKLADIDNFNRSVNTANSFLTSWGLQAALTVATFKVFIGSCKVAAILGFWTDPVVGLGKLATYCLALMMLLVAAAHHRNGDEVLLPLLNAT
eukprot:CAMPEP_0197683100 /NCGR_PEP_ID=MMETSP1338-20131121/97433_1 /TAXON_ID=43686 ORGANISM="Pelagodinium beii, Strain RCC1491" /NCGR_SAMPLE_ID=MMETSP1338 /ASSEMBLY_ACC=CAM_ASM_000754 /LENGTH=121 /DNA_ID=CAMNT_0043264637 /DNA_START=74 /DNA_END=435 /DNA_ORIENTATION=+